ncbi:hypothetical protein [Haloterrigena salinisoli]|uniref:hypothetical protein n=1 Tax=Haloterrigena salinisoli TaxID=3132747 RepID=UPI0030D30B8B
MLGVRPDPERPTASDQTGRARADPTDRSAVLIGVASAAISANTLVGLLLSSTETRRTDRSASSATGTVTRDDATATVSYDDATASAGRARRLRRRLETAVKRYVDPLFRMPRITDQ